MIKSTATARRIGDTGQTATDFVEFYDEQRATLARQIFGAPVVPGDTSGHVPDADTVASRLFDLARLEALRDLWERAAAGDSHPDGGTRGGTTVEVAWRTAVRAAMRALRADTSASNPAVMQIERARRAAAHQWLTDMRSHKMLDPAMVLELL